MDTKRDCGHSWDRADSVLTCLDCDYEEQDERVDALRLLWRLSQGEAAPTLLEEVRAFLDATVQRERKREGTYRRDPPAWQMPKEAKK